VDVEGDLLGRGGPLLVAEAIGVFSILRGREGVVAGRAGWGEELFGAVGAVDL